LHAWNGGALPTYTLIEFNYAALELSLLDVSSAVLVERLRRLMKSTRAAGIGTSLLFQLYDDTTTFTFAPSTSLVASTALGFADSGSPGTGGHLRGAVRA
jgi:hypothetical protein